MSPFAHGGALSGQVIDAAMEVHSLVGPGLLESAYRACLCTELALRGLRVETEVPLSLIYKAITVNVAYRMDVVVERSLVIEIKTVERFHPAHRAQLLSYLKLSGMNVGLLLNFHAQSLRDGIKRVVN